MQTAEIINTGYDGRGGKRPGAGRAKGSQSVPVSTRERLVAAKADREEHLAALAAMERAEKEGSLIAAAEAEKSSRRAGMAIRDAMLSIPGRYAAQLAPLEDEREIERILSDAIRTELTRIARTVLKSAA